MSQVQIVGKNKKVVVFSIHIYTHYDNYRCSMSRFGKSFKPKWSLIKHDVLKFICGHAHVVGMNKSGTSATDSA